MVIEIGNAMLSNETMMVKIVIVLLVVHLPCKAIKLEMMIVTLWRETMMAELVLVILAVKGL